MAEDYKTSEAMAFREHYDKLVDSIQEPDLPVLGARFFSRQIISRETMEMVGNVTTSRAVRASKLILAVMAVLETHPDKFESVLNVFRKEPVYAEISGFLEETFRYFCGESQELQTSTQSTSSSVEKYATYLRKVYLRSKLPAKGKWPPSPCKKIIKLAAIERKEQTRVPKLSRLESVDEYMQENSMSPVSMDDILQPRDDSLPKIVVVRGVPGIGKSTFAWKFCRRWAKGKIYQQYDLVVLLRMRDTRVREATKLSDLFFSENLKFSDDVTEKIFYREGKNAVFLIEGIDELPASCLADGTLLSNLLQGESLPEVTIMVTTRPWAEQMLIEKYGHQISRQIEILGFTKDDVLRYVSHTFTKEKERAEFLEYLRTHPQLVSIMHIPLNSAFVVQIYKQFKHSQQAIPHTLTQLYKALVEGLLIRYSKSVSEFKELKLSNLGKLPEPIKTQFEQLCLLAFMSFTKLSVQVAFTDSEAALYGCLDSLGLMQSSADFAINTSSTVTHSFLHFTIQEFLAAYHLSKQPAQVQKLFLETHKNDNHFYMLLNFLVGLNSDSLHYFGGLVDPKISTVQLHRLFESQCPEAVCKYLGNGVVVYDNKALAARSHDLYALTYCICNSNCKWNLSIDISRLASVYCADLPYDGGILTLTVWNVSSSSLLTIFSLPKRIFRTLFELGIGFKPKLDSESGQVIDSTSAQIIKSGLIPHLKRFGYLSQNLSIINSIPLSALCDSFLDLSYIEIGTSLITTANMLRLCQYITSPTRSSQLKLSLYNNSYSEDSFQMLISAVACATYLTGFYLSKYELSRLEIEMLSVALSSTSSLRSLDVSRCSIDGEGAELLANGLEENKTLERVYLSNNNIDANGAAALALMLAKNNHLKKLDLNRNTLIGTEGAIRLINAMEENKTLKELILSPECEPIEYRSILLQHIRSENHIFFNSQ